MSSNSTKNNTTKIHQSVIICFHNFDDSHRNRKLKLVRERYSEQSVYRIGQSTGKAIVAWGSRPQ
eukprot:scaffold159525_cov18-Prasinocladus_malaysianus.AAC.1